MTSRRYPITVDSYARDMEGVIVHVVAEHTYIDGSRRFTVRYPGGPEVQLLEGFLEALPSAYAP
jgi:hypothetical protein